MKLELTVREWFALLESGIGRINKRKIFGTVGLKEKLWLQFNKQVPEWEIMDMKKEWKKIITDVPPTPPKSPKVSKKVVANTAPKSRGETRVWRPE